MTIPFEIRGAKAMQRKIERLAKEYANRVERALRVEAELVMTRSKRDFVPVDLGVLRASGRVAEVRRRGRDLEVSMVYGDASAPYAAIQHENPDFAHRVGSWKYLEIPLREAVPGMNARIAAEVRL